MTEGARFACPLTQESLADAMGLSVVHANRILQELRGRDLVVVERGWVHLNNSSFPAKVTGFAPRRSTS